jgi:hypothetical protein
MPSWLSAALVWFFGNLLWDFILAAVVAAVIAWLKKKKEAWAAPGLYALVSFVAVFVLAFTLVGHPLLSQQTPTTTPENIEANIKTWCDTFSMGMQKQSLDPRTDFMLMITIPDNGRKFLASKFKERPRYLVFEAHVPISGEDQAIVNKFSREQNLFVYHEVRLELSRSSVGFAIADSGMGTPIRELVLVKRIPITNDFTEDKFLTYVYEIDHGIVMAGEAVTLAVRLNQTKPRPALLQ